MGYLHYGTNHIYRFCDRTLAHLRTVISSKLLQQESFVLSWSDEGQQFSLWLHPAGQLVFEFEKPVTDELDRAWLEQMINQANSPSGLKLSKTHIDE